MPQIQYGLSSYERAEGDLPELPVINLYAEEAPTESGGVMLQSRKGIADRAANMGAGPVRQLFKRDLVLGSALFGVSGSELYRGATPIGGIDGNGFVSMAGYENFLFVTAGSRIWGYDGTTLAPLAFPDSASVAKVVIGGSRLVGIRKDTGKFYWTAPLDTAIDALSFATAENSPDRLLDALFIDDILLLFGAETVEFWPNTGSADLPFTALEGRVIEKGIKATGCATAIGSTFAWVTNQNQVCLQDENTIISNPGLEAQIKASATCSLFTFLIDGQEFLALRIDGETHVWGLRSKAWSEFQSYGQANWLPQCYAGGVFGSAIDGRTFEWSAGHEDLGGVLERRFRGGFPLDSGAVNIDNVQLRLNIGQTPFLAGDYAQPQVEMRISRDAGQTWGNWCSTSLGAQGQYRKKVQWRACGVASQPAFLAEFRCADPVPFRVAGTLVNEPYGGR